MVKVSKAQISGTVYRDFNANGVKDNSATFNETGVAGITISAYNSAGTLVASTTSAANGTYSLSGLTFPVRIEFTGYSNYDYSAPSGSGNKSSVQFYNAASSAANFGINYPQHYTSTTNPYYIVSQFEANRPPSSEPLATAMLKQQYGTRGNSSFAPSIAKTSEIGSTWAVAYDRKNDLIYAAAFAKRHAAMKDNDADGKEDLGAIYSMTSSGSAVLWKDLSTLGIDFGTSLLPTIAARALPTTITGPSHDATMFGLVGKIGIGGITLSDDFTKLYVMNLYDKKIYTIDIATKTLIGTSSVVPNSCSSGNSRPFALKYHRGKVYVGSVCDATTSGNFNDLKATVYSYNGTSFTSILTYPLNYVKGYVFKDLDDNNSNGIQEEWGKQWNAWSDVMPSSIFTSNLTSPASQVILNPQPMLVGLEFDIDESLIMVFNDRFGHQAGQVNYGTNTGNTTNFYTGLAAGDMLRASYSAGTYTLENGGVVGGLTGNTTNANGPGGGEFYQGDHDSYNYHAENLIGGSLIFPGKGEVATVVTDPIGYWTGGVYFFDNTNGNVTLTSNTDAYQLYASTLNNTKFGKVNGLGDIELITDAAPIEIGNRVWIDTDGDGIQDAGENPIAGVVVQLVDGSGTVIATATTDANGNYYFSSATGSSTSSTIYGLSILPNTNYTIRIPNAIGGSKQAALGTYVLTTVNAGSNDLIDNDASLVGNNADISITAGNYGENNHTYDFGFKICSLPAAPTCSIVAVCTGADATTMVTAAVSPVGGTITWNTGNAATATSYTYTVTNSCGSANCTNTVTRNPLPVAAIVTGSSVVCVQCYEQLFANKTGGVWLSDNNNYATVNPTGLIQGLISGAGIISYKITDANNCTITTSYPITITPKCNP